MPEQDPCLATLVWLDAGLAERRWPEPGARAVGQGVVGVVLAVPRAQPLAVDDIWRVTLVGERFGRLVARRKNGAWHLLQEDELTDEQLDALEVVVPVAEEAA